MEITINGDLVLELESKNEWINKCPDYLPKLRIEEKLLFVDKNNNVLTIGADFIAATIQDAYPVRIYHLTRTSKSALQNTNI